MLAKLYISKKFFIVNFMYFFIILSCCYLFIKYAFVLFLPVIIGGIIAIITRKMCILFFKNKIIGILFIFLFWCVITIIFYVLFWAIIWGIIYLSRNFTTLKTDIFDSVSQLSSKYKFLFETKNLFINNLLENFKNALLNMLLNITIKFGGSLASVIAFLPNFILHIIVTVMTSFFTYIEYDKITVFLANTNFYKHLKPIKNSAIISFINLLKAQLILFCIVFILLFIGLSVIGIKFAILIALLIALADLLPIIGLNMIMLPWGISLILLSNIRLGISIILLSVLIFIVKEIIEPKIVSDKIGISPLVILLGAYFGYILFGAVGLILAPFVISFVSVFTLKSSNN